MVRKYHTNKIGVHQNLGLCKEKIELSLQIQKAFWTNGTFIKIRKFIGFWDLLESLSNKIEDNQKEEKAKSALLFTKA